MNRFHVHVHVGNLDESIRFYSSLFGATPTVTKPDYAKWMLDDPQGIRWESFHTHGDATTYYAPMAEAVERDACCGPMAGGGCRPEAKAGDATLAPAPQASCRVPAADQVAVGAKSTCCA